MFSCFAKYIIEKNDVVFGAILNKSYTELYHLKVENLDDLDKLRGSKYLQSDISNTYALVRDELIDKRLVLFSGTPCQIFALKKY